MKIITVVIGECLQGYRVNVPGKHLLLSPMFASKATAYINEARLRCFFTLGNAPGPQILDQAGKTCQ